MIKYAEDLRSYNTFPLPCGRTGVGPLSTGVQSINKILLHESFNQTIAALRSTNIELPSYPETSYSFVYPSPDGGKVEKIEEHDRYKLVSKKGQELLSKNIRIFAYDESINKYSALEGYAFFTSHSIVRMSPEKYEPLNLLTFYFYTRSALLNQKSPLIKLSVDPSRDSSTDYTKDKMDFLLNNVQDKSLLFIDGPLIAGDEYTRFIQIIKTLDARRILPIFFVKNSDSNMVVDNIEQFKGRFNSDLHWCHSLLNPAERTAFFEYTDINKTNSKVFCYVKALNTSPVRVEFPTSSFKLNEKAIMSIMDLIQYLIVVQGSSTNPQLRPIAVAEMYARETLKLVNFRKIVKETGLQPTMNEGRGFSW